MPPPGDQLVADAITAQTTAITAQTTAIVAAVNALTAAVGNQTAQAALLAEQVLQAAATLSAQTIAAAELVASVSAQVNKMRLIDMQVVEGEGGKPRLVALDSGGAIWEFLDEKDSSKLFDNTSYKWRRSVPRPPGFV